MFDLLLSFSLISQSLDLHKFGLSEADLDKEFDLSTPEIRGFQQSSESVQFDFSSVL
jgi:hypothetical protein